MDGAHTQLQRPRGKLGSLHCSLRLQASSTPAMRAAAADQADAGPTAAQAAALPTPPPPDASSPSGGAAAAEASDSRAPAPSAPGPCGSRASALPVDLREEKGQRSLAASNGAVLLRGLCAEATVRPHEASGSAVVGLRCSGPPSAVIDVALGQARGVQGAHVSWECLAGPRRGTAVRSFPAHRAPTPLRPVLAAALRPLPGAVTGQAVLVRRPCCTSGCVRTAHVQAHWQGIPWTSSSPHLPTHLHLPRLCPPPAPSRMAPAWGGPAAEGVPVETQLLLLELEVGCVGAAGGRRCAGRVQWTRALAAALARLSARAHHTAACT